MGRGFLFLVLFVLFDASVARATPPPNFVLNWGVSGSANGNFSYPTGVAVDDSGYVYVVDSNNDRIQKFTATGSFITKWGSYGSGNGQFTNPECIAIDRLGFVYVGDGGVPSANQRIQKFTRNGTYVTQWGSPGVGNGQFTSPYGVAVDASGSFVYVADYGNGRIQKFTNAGGFVAAWGGLSYPRSVAVDAAGDVYVADQNNHRVVKFSATGAYLTEWGSYGNGDGSFNTPVGVSADRTTGRIIVSDFNNDRLQTFTNTGVFLAKWGFAGTTDGRFNGPFRAASSSTGNIYVPDRNNHRVQMFSQTVTLPFRIVAPSALIARASGLSGLHLEFTGVNGAADLAVLGNPPGCEPPAVTNPGSPWDITWSSGCVGPGETITFTITGSSYPPVTFVSGYWSPDSIPLSPGDVWLVDPVPVPSTTAWGTAALALALLGTCFRWWWPRLKSNTRHAA